MTSVLWCLLPLMKVLAFRAMALFEVILVLVNVSIAWALSNDWVPFGGELLDSLLSQHSEAQGLFVWTRCLRIYDLVGSFYVLIPL